MRWDAVCGCLAECRCYNNHGVAGAAAAGCVAWRCCQLLTLPPNDTRVHSTRRREFRSLLFDRRVRRIGSPPVGDRETVNRDMAGTIYV